MSLVVVLWPQTSLIKLLMKLYGARPEWCEKCSSRAISCAHVSWDSVIILSKSHLTVSDILVFWLPLLILQDDDGLDKKCRVTSHNLRWGHGAPLRGLWGSEKSLDRKHLHAKSHKTKPEKIYVWILNCLGLVCCHACNLFPLTVNEVWWWTDQPQAFTLKLSGKVGVEVSHGLFFPFYVLL